VVAPLLPDGTAVVGDPGLFVPAGDRRVADVEPDGTVVLSGAPGEVVRLLGWRDRGPSEREVTLPDRGWVRLPPG
jgi:hypothetical protein